MGAQGTFVRGIIDSCPCEPMPLINNEYMKKYYFDEAAIKRIEANDSFVNIADFLLLRFKIHGEVFYPWEGKVLEWKRSLDILHNRAIRDVLWENEKGERTRFHFERFASYADDHVFAIKTIVTPENYDGTIEIISGIDSYTKTIGGSGGGHLITRNKTSRTEGSKAFYACDSGEKYCSRIAIATATKIYSEFSEQSAVWCDGKIQDLITVKTTWQARQGESFTVEKLIYVITSRDITGDPERAAEAAIDELESYDVLYRKHTKVWNESFEKIDISIEGDEAADQALRFCNYHTLGSFNRNDAVHSLAPKGLTGPVYGGLVWWDCEVYQSPLFYMTMPEQAKNLLMYRYRMLDMAKQNAIEEGCRGARYPFNSGITGAESVWTVSRHPFMQIHVVADVAWSICNYYNCSGDDAFMIFYGMEMLYEICRYWMSRTEKDDRGYIIMQVTGTDEHHPYVDNNAYINYEVHLIAKRTLEFTEQYGQQLKALHNKIAFTEKELEQLNEFAENIYLPMEKNTGMIPQFDDYFTLNRELEIVGGEEDATAFQMKASGMYHESQVIKQPDVLVLFAYQNLKLPEIVYKRNWDYYRARCEASSSLSYSVHSICASDMDEPESAYSLFMQTALMDLDDEHHGVCNGVHSACGAGAWMAVVRGIGGTILEAEGVTITPHMIPWWKSVAYSVKWHGQKLKIILTNEEVRIESIGENTMEVPILLCGERQSIIPGRSIVKATSIYQ